MIKFVSGEVRIVIPCNCQVLVDVSWHYQKGYSFEFHVEKRCEKHKTAQLKELPIIRHLSQFNPLSLLAVDSMLFFPYELFKE